MEKSFSTFLTTLSYCIRKEHLVQTTSSLGIPRSKELDITSLESPDVSILQHINVICHIRALKYRTCTLISGCPPMFLS